jgi:hypothetical protein
MSNVIGGMNGVGSFSLHMGLREGEYQSAYWDTLRIRLHSSLLSIGFDLLFIFVVLYLLYKSQDYPLSRCISSLAI